MDCGDNLGFEDGDLNGWNGCHFSGCPIGKTYTDFNACFNECGNCSPQSSGGTITYTCTSCSAGASPTKSPCCPIKCDQTGLKPGVNSVNGTLGNCSVLAPTPGNVRHTVTTGNGLDPNSDGNIPVVAPNGGGFSVRIGNQEAG
ncbi:MAG: hypothetical protein KDD36_14585, partial [Flavobacteriales bacterium]|nr:hypothetical protein [Flavobacteriales bacterium]